MNTQLEQAVADEVLAEIARKHLTHKEVQSAAGMEERTFRRYFVEQSRTIPLPVLMSVADAIGVPAETLIANGRARVEAEDPGLPDDPYGLAAKKRPKK